MMALNTSLRLADIRPANAMTDLPVAIQHDIDWLAARHGSYVSVACPVCNSTWADERFAKFAMTIVACHDCATRYASPRPDEATLKAFYAQSMDYSYWAKHIYPASEETRRLRLFRPRARLATDLARRHGLIGGTLLEVGAGYGIFLDEVRATGAFGRVIGVEPVPDLANRCSSMEFEMHRCAYEDAPELPQLDMISHFEVIEHLFDPRRFLAWCHAGLRSGGLMLFTCPAVDGFEPLIMNRQSAVFDHEHLNLFSTTSIVRILVESGFEVLSVETPGEFDVELMVMAITEGKVKEESLPAFVRRLLAPRLRDATQKFLTAHCLSSNMRVIARRI